MYDIIRSDSRGAADHGWLKAKHTFSFAGYHNPAMMGFGKLRVVNEDRIAGGQGFGTHPHQDMEIVTYLIEGALEHKDSMGNGSIIRPGELQRMSAGTGVLHSEYNASDTDPAHLLQIWILPESAGIEPGYEQKLFTEDEKRNNLRLVGSRDGRNGSLTIHQDLDLYASVLEPGQALEHVFASGRKGFLQLISGKLEVNGATIAAGDGVALQAETTLAIESIGKAEFLLFDMQ
ncbi:MAG: pirin family protein [Pseudomonadota bacterium]